MKEKNILKSAGLAGLGTTVSRILGYGRTAALAWVLGAGFSMDAFTIAFRLANLFRRLVAEGSMSAAFVPVFVSFRRDHSEEALWQFARRFFYVLLAVTVAIVILETACAPLIVKVMAPGFGRNEAKWELTVYLTRLMAPYLVFVALSALLMGVLNSFGHFLMPAVSTAFFNACMIVSAFTLTRVCAEPAVAVGWGVLIGGLFQMMCQVPLARRMGMSFQFSLSFQDPAIRRIGRLLLPSIFGVGVIQINLLIDSVMGSLLREGSVSYLYYADRIMELVLGIFVISFSTVILPEMSRSAAERDLATLKSTLVFSYRTTAFVSIPATVALFLLATPVINVLFERGNFSSFDTKETAFALAYYALGLCAMSGLRLTIPAFYALQDTKTPVKIATVGMCSNLILNWILMHPLKQGGIALATSLSSFLMLFLLVRNFEKRFGKLMWRQLLASLAKMLTAAVVMGVVSFFFLLATGFRGNLPILPRAGFLLGTIVCGLITYLLMAAVLKVEEASFIRRFYFRGHS